MENEQQLTLNTEPTITRTEDFLDPKIVQEELSDFLARGLATPEIGKAIAREIVEKCKRRQRNL